MSLEANSVARGVSDTHQLAGTWREENNFGLRAQPAHRTATQGRVTSINHQTLWTNSGAKLRVWDLPRKLGVWDLPGCLESPLGHHADGAIDHAAATRPGIHADDGLADGPCSRGPGGCHDHPAKSAPNLGTKVWVSGISLTNVWVSGISLTKVWVSGISLVRSPSRADRAGSRGFLLRTSNTSEFVEMRQSGAFFGVLKRVSISEHVPAGRARTEA